MSECRLQRPDGIKNAFSFAEGPVTLGRGADARLRLDDEFISRVHCEVFLRNNQVVIRDHNSHNGTFVNGTKVQEAVLATGDKLQLGKTNLVFQLNVRMVPPQPPQTSPQHDVDAIFRIVTDEPQRVDPARTVLIPGTQLAPPKT